MSAQNKFQIFLQLMAARNVNNEAFELAMDIQENNLALRARVKELEEALEIIGKLSGTCDRHIDDYGEIARKALKK